jgi:predicted helicase
MLSSVEEILRKEFGRELGDKNVHIIDPFVGTGNFMVNLMRRLPKTQLEYKYREELHCNEVMLLPYYVATMNIEHTFLEQTGQYQSFPGVCLVDTFETAEKQTEFGFFNPENTERVKRQRTAPIFVVLGNPPYNANQVNENDNNKNRKYHSVDARISETYAKDSTATLLNKLSGDPYVKAYRWASDRLKDEGIVAFVSNSSFISKRQFDGMRKHLRKDFQTLYILNLQGEVREGRHFAGTTHNVFGIQLGISINLLIRGGKSGTAPARIFYHSVPEDWRRERKLAFLARTADYRSIDWNELVPDKRNTWLTEGLDEDFEIFAPLGLKKFAGKLSGPKAPLLLKYALGISTNRDDVVYGVDANELSARVREFIGDYNSEVDRYHAKKRRTSVDDFVDTSSIKWSRDLKQELEKGHKFQPTANAIRRVEHRPFFSTNIWLQDAIVDRIGPLWTFIPPKKSSGENRIMCITGPGSQKEFMALMTNCLVDLHFVGAASATQCFPFYRYDAENDEQHENIPLSTLIRFEQHYDDETITKWDIFHYVYAVLHHPEYRARYAANLRRELPRIPFIAKEAKTFHAFAEIGQELADLHANYEDAPEYKLQRIENPDESLNWGVEKMRLSKDKSAIIYNEFLTLDGIPKETFNYRLGNRSALDWVIDQYQVSIDKRSGITNDPNRDDEPDYIVKLIGKVITVSLQTQKLVATLPALEIATA